jgi:hypothetical protein
MNSLSDLNRVASQGLFFNDNRPENYEFEPVFNPTISAYENHSFQATPGTEITTVINPSSVISFSVNVGRLPGTTVSWGNLSGLGSGSLVANTQGTVYTVSGIRSAGDWRIVRSPVITMATNPPNAWTFDSTISYKGNLTQSWTTTITVTQLDQLTTANDFYYSDAVNTVTGVPQVYEVSVPAFQANTYTVVMTASNTSVYSNITTSSRYGATYSYNAAQGRLSMTGNIVAVNDMLNNIVYFTPPGLDQTWIATYTLANPVSQFTSSVQQLMRSQSSVYLSRPTPTYYNKNVGTAITNNPTIVDTISNAAGTYTMTVSSLESGAVTSLSATGGLGGSSSFASNVLTMTGNRAQVNSFLANISFQPGTDYVQNFHMQYSVRVPGGNVASRLQDFYLGSTNTIAGNLNVNRSFVGNTPDQLIFANATPYIIETTNLPYTVILSSTAGQFGFANTAISSPFSFTGNYSQVNSMMSSVRFYPTINVVGNQTMTYTQLRNGVQQLSQTIALIGTARSTTIPGMNSLYTFTTNSTFTPTFEQAYYLYMNSLLVGGGGGGGYYLSPGSTGGGGGSGGVMESWTLLRSLNPVNIVVGRGQLGVGTNTEVSNGIVDLVAAGGDVGKSNSTGYASGGGSGGTSFGSNIGSQQGNWTQGNPTSGYYANSHFYGGDGGSWYTNVNSNSQFRSNLTLTVRGLGGIDNRNPPTASGIGGGGSGGIATHTTPTPGNDGAVFLKFKG